MRRDAFSLVEILVTLSIGSTVLAIAVGTVHRSMLVSDTAQDTARQTLQLNRFLEQFRNDVHLGKSIALHSTQSLTMELADGSTVDYGVEANLVTRNQETSGVAPIREYFVLAENTKASFAFDEASRLTSLRILKDLELFMTPPRLERFVEAILGRTATSYTIDGGKP